MAWKKSLIFLLSIMPMLGGCSTGLLRPEIHKAEIQKANISLKGNYQALLMCLDQNGIKSGQIDMCCGVSSRIYPELGKAEMSVQNASGYYFTLFEFTSIAKNKTRLDIYGVGTLGNTYISEWTKTLQSCEANGR